MLCNLNNVIICLTGKYEKKGFCDRQMWTILLHTIKMVNCCLGHEKLWLAEIKHASRPISTTHVWGRLQTRISTLKVPYNIVANQEKNQILRDHCGVKTGSHLQETCSIMELWTQKFNVKSAPEYYKLTLQTYNKVKYISFEIFSSFCLFV